MRHIQVNVTLANVYVLKWLKIIYSLYQAQKFISIFPWLYFQYSTIQAASLLLCPWVWQSLRCPRLSEGGRLSALCPVPPGRYGWVRRTAAEVSLWAGYPRGHICYSGKLECSSIMTRIKRQWHAHNVNH